MRRHWLAPVVLALLLVAGTLPARAQEQPNNVVVVNRAEEQVPADLLDSSDVERLTRLQRETVFTVPFSPISPDDRSVLIAANTQIGFLDIQDGSTVELPLEAFGPLAPLPLLNPAAFSFTWLDERTLGALALNTAANDPNDAVVRVLINRDTLEVSAEQLRFPANTSIVSIAPDLSRFLLVVLPELPTASPQSESRVRVAIRPPQVAASSEQQVPMPAQLRATVERARASKAYDRFWMMQDSASAETVEVAPRKLDLVLYTAGEAGARYVTTIPEASALLSSSWTRDSGKLAVSFFGLADGADRPGRDGALISQQVYRDATGNLPPGSNPIIQDNNTYVVDYGSGDVRVLRPDAAPNAPILEAHDWAPDNQSLLVKAWHPARLRGRTFPVYFPQYSERVSFRFYNGDLQQTGTLESTLFSAGLFSEARAQFITPDEVLFRAVGGTDRQPYYYNRVSGELRNLADRAGSYWNIEPTNQSRQLVFMYNSFTQPPDIYKLGWDGQGLSRLTWFNEEQAQFAGMQQHPVSFTLRNGQRRSGVLIQPAGAAFPPRNQRVVVWQQGGPGAYMLNTWATNVEDPYSLLPAMGIAVLVTPLSGRPGYTPAAFNALADNGNFGAIDIDEQAEIVAQMVQRGWTSRGKVGITGCSYGGYFTLQSVIRHPDTYAAANAQCALVDLFTEWTRGFDTLMPYLQGLPPFNAPEEYRRDSPSYNANRVKAAVLMFHGTEDFLPIVENENLHIQLVNRGVPARFVKFVGEGHGLSDGDNQLYAAQEQLNWFRTRLAP